MQYSRSISFVADPDYRYILGLFEGLMEKNQWDPKVADFLWNKNRLELEKLALKQNMMKALQKPTKKQDGTPEAEDQGNAKQNLI